GKRGARRVAGLEAPDRAERAAERREAAGVEAERGRLHLHKLAAQAELVGEAALIQLLEKESGGREGPGRLQEALLLADRLEVPVRQLEPHGAVQCADRLMIGLDAAF